MLVLPAIQYIGLIPYLILIIQLQEWQKKLSQLKVTQLPWDPAPPPPTHPVPSTATDRKPPPQPAPLPSNNNATPTPPVSNPLGNPGPRVKQEPGAYPTQSLPSNNYPLPLPQGPQNADIARQRAAAHLQQQFGARAGNQVAQLQHGSRLPPQAMPQQIPMKRENQEPQIKREPQEPIFKQEDQKPPMAIQHGGLSQQYKAPINPSQLDGPSDDMQAYRVEIARRRELIASQRGTGDRLFREHLLSSQQRLEGGGLMLPLDERYAPAPGVRRQIQTLEVGESSNSNNQGAIRDIGSLRSSLASAQGDAAGDDDDDEVDEDAINSDLDDPDEVGVDNNEEETDQVMLCTYDKVARVKNKWKCTLKDGILRVDGTE
jgi:transcription initiation factor TFIIA large subunit